MRVDWSDLALDDLDDVTRYISKDSPYYARKFAEHIFDSTDRLIDFPLSGRAVPEAEDKNVRELIVRGYRIMYLVESDRVLVLAVMHGRRDLGGMEEKPWEDRE